jgi:hypothetical protein
MMSGVEKNGWLLGLVLGFSILGLALGSELRADAMADFRAFWCGGVAIAQHANPYLQQPLQRCEQLAGPPWEGPVLRQVALPAPLPPYGLLGYATLSRLSFPVAIALYGAVLVGALTAAIVLLSRTIGISSLTIAAVLAPMTWSDAILRGQPFSLVLLAFAGAAFFALRSCPAAAALCLMGAMIQPHVALPAVLAVFVLWPRTRIPVLLGSVALGFISVAAVGPQVALSYMRDVLPAHALANAYEWQLSLTSLLTYFGVAASQAVSFGTGSYIVMACLGVLVAARLVHRENSLVPAVLIPPAFGVFLGVHVHYHQLAIAFPAMLYVMVRANRGRALAGGGIAAAMLPWDTIVAPALVAMWMLIAGGFGRFAFGPRWALVPTLAAAAFVIGTSLAAFLWPALGAGGAPFVAHPYPPDALAEVSWADFSRQELSRSSPLLLWLRAPTILGIACGLAAIARFAFVPQCKELSETRVVPIGAEV